ncbi:MAG: histidinol dehydrogenase, partial [Candidatus Devosia euplotis]|nr:histidinol dehydrogenase [Candidatus Devosia euplotis]
MPVRLDSADTNFEQRFVHLLEGKREASQDINDAVFAIIADVRKRGDIAVVELTNKFDHANVTLDSLRISSGEIAAAAAGVSGRIRGALQLAHDRIWSHHAKQKPDNHIYTDHLSVALGTRWTPVDAVGVYVPGGLASYPFSALMNAVPAKVAGVARIAMVAPAPNGEINPAILLAAQIAGVTEIYRIGGAQAVAALAYGTASIPRVDKVVGPGNAYVATAKRQVFGHVGIDMIA